MNFREFFITNRWWGKILGCFFGYLVGGAIGAFFGIIVGNFFDQGLMSHFAKAHWSDFSLKEDTLQNSFIEASFKVLGHMAKASGRVTETYIRMAERVMVEMGLSKAQKKLARTAFTEGKKTTFDLRVSLQAFQITCRSDPSLLQLFMNIQYQGLQVDGFSTKKLAILNAACKELGFAPLYQQSRFYQGQDTYSQRNHQRQAPQRHFGLEESYALLEVPMNATQAEVKRAYRRVIGRNHPDKLIAKGLPESAIKAANDKTQKITKAYEYICKSKGW